MSKLSVFADKLMEAGWLAAIILAPLFFNVYSSRVFEPDKISLVRSIALVMAAAWVIRWLDQWRLMTRAEQGAAPSLLQGWRARLSDWSRRNPLTLATLFFVAAYLVSTLASVSPSVSLLGSYQRLQGLYSTLSYIVIFLIAAGGIRTREQFDRVVTLALVNSVPISLYGIIQHYHLDPLPWGGDTTYRVAANMGNSIFVGAYLIMVLPLGLARLIETAQRAAQDWTARPPRLYLYAAAGLSALLLAGVWGATFDLNAKRLIDANQGALTPEGLAAASSDFTLALGLTFIVVLTWFAAGFISRAPARAGQGNRPAAFLLLGVYAFVLAVQAVCLVYSQSRGPLLGILGGLFVFAVLYALARRARVVAFGGVAAAVVGLVFLILFNTAAASPLAELRNSPYIGRLGRVLDTSDGTTQVRILIWTGALQLALPHDPLWSPLTGADALNPLRPLIGYGPETMYVTYNRFYPPDLGNLESRNASPDRSHNETFDSLVMTGLLGFAAYIALFLSVFYYALKWLGLVNTPRERNVFVALWLGGALVLALAFGLTLGWNFLGVAVPAGMITGMLVYLSAFALLRRTGNIPVEPGRALWLIALLSAIVGHFIEINFGIAIAATRTYFWVLAALLVVAGTGQVANWGVSEPAPAGEPASATKPARKRARRENSAPVPARPARQPSAPVPQAFLTGLILATMGFNYVTTQLIAGPTVGLFSVVWGALTLRQTTAGPQTSYAMFWLFALTLLVAAALVLAEWGRPLRLPTSDWLAAGSLFVILALAIFTSFLLYHTLLLTTEAARLGQALLATIEMFTFFVLIMLVVSASAFLFDVTLPTPWVAREWNWAAAPLLAVASFLLIGASNISVIQGDILYKQAAGYELNGQWDGAVAVYTTALQRQPNQDYYLLFLGRAYLESARNLEDAAARELRLQEAERVLLQAQRLNPLNTDHTANLARLHRGWANMISDDAARARHLDKALEYYAATLRLSPHTAHLWNEWAETLLARGDRAAALEKLVHSQELDPKYPQTRLYLGEYYRTAGDWDRAAEAYLAAIRIDPNVLSTPEGYPLQEPQEVFIRANRAGEAADIWQAALERDPKLLYPRLARAELLRRLNRLDEARREFEAAVQYWPQNVLALTLLANFYSENGEIDKAIPQVKAALALIPADRTNDVNRYQGFLAGLQQLQDALNAIVKNPNDLEARRRAAALWLARSQPDRALKAYQEMVRLKPDDVEAVRAVALLLVQLDQLAPAQPALAQAAGLAPEKDRELLNRLSLVVGLALQGDRANALAQAEALAGAFPASDTLAQSALAALIVRLK